MAFVLVALLATVTTFGQGGSSSLSGRVTDPSGALVSGAKVEASNMATNVNYRAETNESGIYVFPNVQPGTYQISANMSGFKSVLRKDVELHVADNTSIDFVLELGSAAESVTVSGGAPLVNTSTSSLGGLVSSRALQDLPLNGRNYIDLTLMQPGVTTNPNTNKTGSYTGVWFSTNGASVRSNNFTIDGAIMQDQNSGSTADFAGRTLGLDGVQEYRVLTGVFSAEYGISMGSQSVMVSKGGGNQIHGNVFGYLRNSVLDAANFFDKPLAANGFRRSPAFHRMNFGASMGGPIVKDKTFFFGAFEGVKESLGTTTIDNVPAASCHGPSGAVVWNGLGTQPAGSIGPCTQLGANPNGAGTNSVTIVPSVAPLLALYPNPNLANNQVSIPYSQPDADYFGQIRVDHSFSEKDSLFGRYTVNDDTSAAGQTYPNYFVLNKLTRHSYVTLSESHIFSPTTLNTLRLSFSRTASNRNSPTDFTGPQYSFVPGRYIGLIQVGGVTPFGPPQASPSIQTQNIGALTDDLSHARGKHSLKFGVAVNSYRQYALNSSGAFGAINFSNLANFLQGRLQTYNAIAPGSTLDRTHQFNVIGLYAQDDWRVLSNLTINAGVRWEFSPSYYKEVHGVSAGMPNPLTDTSLTVGPYFNNPTWKNISPRLGFAWDPLGNGKTAVRGGAGIFYDIANLANSAVNFNTAQPPFSYRSQVSGGNLTLPLVFPAASFGKTINIADYNLKNARLYSFSMTVEQQLPGSMALSVSYAGSRGVHIASLREANPFTPIRQADGTLFWPAGVSRLNPAWDSIQVQMASAADSTYHSMQVGVLKRMTKSLQFQSSYTFGKALDNAQGGAGDNTSSSSFPANPFDGRYDRGLASFSLKHTWIMNAIYSLPSPDWKTPVLGGLARGWSLSGIFNRHSGFPFTPLVTTQRSRSGVAGGSNANSNGIDRPNWNPAFTGNVIQGGPNQYYNPAAFVLQPVGTLGNVSRNSLTGPGFVSLDVTVKKDSPLKMLGEAGKLEFRVEFFNVLNHPNFGMPNTGVFAGNLANATEAPLTTAGVITNTIGTARQGQLALRILW